MPIHFNLINLKYKKRRKLLHPIFIHIYFIKFFLVLFYLTGFNSKSEQEAQLQIKRLKIIFNFHFL